MSRIAWQRSKQIDPHKAGRSVLYGVPKGMDSGPMALALRAHSLCSCVCRPASLASVRTRVTSNRLAAIKTNRPAQGGSFCFVWRPQGDSNPCYRRERAVS